MFYCSFAARTFDRRLYANFSFHPLVHPATALFEATDITKKPQDSENPAAFELNDVVDVNLPPERAQPRASRLYRCNKHALSGRTAAERSQSCPRHRRFVPRFRARSSQDLRRS